MLQPPYTVTDSSDSVQLLRFSIWWQTMPVLVSSQPVCIEPEWPRGQGATYNAAVLIKGAQLASDYL